MAETLMVPRKDGIAKRMMQSVAIRVANDVTKGISEGVPEKEMTLNMTEDVIFVLKGAFEMDDEGSFLCTTPIIAV